jgi:hypothetical protein
MPVAPARTGRRRGEETPMDRLDRKSQRLVALCILGFLLFNYPLLALFNRAGLVLGIPVLYAYIFAAWAVLIALMAIVAGRSSG